MTLLNNSLSGYGVLITRPLLQGELLGEMVRQRGGVPFLAPLLEIEFPDQTLNHFFESMDLNEVAVYVFVSRYAVEAVCQCSQVQYLQGMRIAAIGNATKSCLQEYGVDVEYSPIDTFDSEGLLAAFDEIDLSGKRIVIFRGQSGRETLAQGLRARGAKVSQIPVYKRIWTDNDLAPILLEWLAFNSRIVTATSGELVQQLMGKTPRENRLQVLQSNVVTLSNRVANICLELGFCRQIQVANRADNNAIINSLCQVTI